MKKYFAILIVLSLPFFSLAQIKIEERAEILPQNVILPETPAGDHTIRVDIQWSPASLRGWILFYNLQCDQNNYSSTPSTSGSNTYSLTSTGYENYNIQFRFGYLDPNQPTITGTYQLYYDEQLIISESFQAQPATYSSYAYFNTHYQSPVFTDYSFNIAPASLCFGNGTTPGFTLGHGCTNFEIDTSSEMVNLQILSGGEFASFYGYQGMVTDNLAVPYSSLNSVQLKQDQFFSGSATTVLIQSNIGGLIKQDSIIAYPKSGYGIIASTFDYPIQHGETKYTEVKPYGPGGCTSIFPQEIKLNAVITVGKELGHLKDFDYGTEGDTLTNITFNSFGGNHIGFIADGIKKDIADTVVITYSTTDAELGTSQVAVVINPDPLFVSIEPSTLAPGEMATLIIKSRQEDGTLIDFPPDQTFEIGMLDGCTLGNIIVGSDTGQYFYDVTQPIKFLADSLAEGGTVKLIVGLIEDLIIGRPVTRIGNLPEDGIEKAGGDKETIDENAEGMQGITPNNPVISMCFIEDIRTYTTQEIDLPVGDECEEEIIVCNNYTPPKFEDVGTITVVSENDSWQWIDQQGNSQTTNTGNACNLNPQPGEFGKTYIMPKIGDFAPGNLVYNLLDDTKVTVCQDKNDPTDPIWRYSVENLRVPIFRDHCPAWPIANNYVDLLDGTNADTLAKYIKNCSDYIKVIATLDWWWDGPYFHAGQSPPYKFYFSAGVIAHENIHVKQMKDGGTKYFPVGSIHNEMKNGKYGFRALTLYKYSANIAKCPKDALAAVQGTGTMEERVKIQLDAALTTANDLVSLGGQDNQGRDNSELEADELARPKYDEIKTNIENWAKQQSWWCIPWPIVGGDYYRGCDKSDCTP